MGVQLPPAGAYNLGFVAVNAVAQEALVLNKNVKGRSMYIILSPWATVSCTGCRGPVLKAHGKDMCFRLCNILLLDVNRGGFPLSLCEQEVHRAEGERKEDIYGGACQAIHRKVVMFSTQHLLACSMKHLDRLSRFVISETQLCGMF